MRNYSLLNFFVVIILGSSAMANEPLTMTGSAAIKLAEKLISIEGVDVIDAVKGVDFHARPFICLVGQMERKAGARTMPARRDVNCKFLQRQMVRERQEDSKQTSGINIVATSYQYRTLDFEIADGLEIYEILLENGVQPKDGKMIFQSLSCRLIGEVSQSENGQAKVTAPVDAICDIAE